MIKDNGIRASRDRLNEFYRLRVVLARNCAIIDKRGVTRRAMNELETVQVEQKLVFLAANVLYAHNAWVGFPVALGLASSLVDSEVGEGGRAVSWRSEVLKRCRDHVREVSGRHNGAGLGTVRSSTLMMMRAAHPYLCPCVDPPLPERSLDL